MLNNAHSEKSRVRTQSGPCLLALALSGAFFSFSGCGPKESPDPDPVVIEVGERSIRVSELQKQIDFLAAKNVRLAYDSQAFIDDVVERAVALNKARELGLHEDVELQRQMENLLIGRLKQRELQLALDTLSISDEELKAYYEDNVDKYGRPAQSRFALLHLPANKFTDEAAREALVERLKEAKQLASDLPADTRGFGALAMRYSEEATSRFKGGDIGWLQVGRERYRWPDAVVDTGFALQVGELSDVIETEEGVYLLMKTDSRDEVRPALEGRFAASMMNAALREKRERIIKDFEKDWAEGVALKLNEEALGHLEFQGAPLETTQTAPLPRNLP